MVQCKHSVGGSQCWNKSPSEYCHHHRPKDYIIPTVDTITPTLRQFSCDSRYFKGKIYQLKHKDFEDGVLYVGHTRNPLEVRLKAHRQYQCKLMRAFMKDKNNADLQIELLEAYPCYNKDMLSVREQYWIDKLKPAKNHSPAWNGLSPLPIDYNVLEKKFNDTFNSILSY
jgi:hypothetical protein